MNTITYQAGEKLKTTLEEANASPGECLRLVLTAQGGQFQLDRKASDDEVYDFNGEPVLVVDPTTSQKLVGRSLDCQEDRLCLVKSD
jgi:hypothetical protein